MHQNNVFKNAKNVCSVSNKISNTKDQRGLYLGAQGFIFKKFGLIFGLRR